MYRVDRNNFYKNAKKTVVYTPSSVSNFLFKVLKEKVKDGFIFDPCVGKGSLLMPWKEKGYKVLGIDIGDQGFEGTIIRNYLDIKKGEIDTPSLILVNPPFNIDSETKDYIKKHYSSRPLLPELWLEKTIELFGKDIPICLFTPYGFRLNQTIRSKRWKRFSSGFYPEITSIISLPKDLFKDILFHSEVLLFNIQGLKGHYFL